MQAVALTIAGSDPSGGAGLQADLKTFHQHEVYGMSVVTLLTVQNTQTVDAVETVAPALVESQFRACVDDIPPDAIKTGALGSEDIIDVVAEGVAGVDAPLVVDPVMISKHGAPLADKAAVDRIRRRLLPLTTLLTPNLHEATVLAGFEVNSRSTMEAAARAIADMGPRNVLIKGGHLDSDAVDLLWTADSVDVFAAPRQTTSHTHGTGCVYSAAITARLARGESLPEAVAGAKQFISEAIRMNPGLGGGFGPVNMMVSAH